MCPIDDKPPEKYSERYLMFPDDGDYIREVTEKVLNGKIPVRDYAHFGILLLYELLQQGFIRRKLYEEDSNSNRS